MNIIIKNYKRALHLLIIGLLTLNCAGDRDPNSGSPPPISPVGEYQISLLILRWSETPGEQQTEIVTTDCDLISTIKFNSNNTLTYTNYNISNENDCSDSEIILGNWNANPNQGAASFNGEFTFNDLYNGQEVLYGQYQDLGEDGIAMKFTFTTSVDGINYHHLFNAIKI